MYHKPILPQDFQSYITQLSKEASEEALSKQTQENFQKPTALPSSSFLSLLLMLLLTQEGDF